MDLTWTLLLRSLLFAVQHGDKLMGLEDFAEIDGEVRRRDDLHVSHFPVDEL